MLTKPRFNAHGEKPAKVQIPTAWCSFSVDGELYGPIQSARESEVYKTIVDLVFMRNLGVRVSGIKEVQNTVKMRRFSENRNIFKIWVL